VLAFATIDDVAGVLIIAFFYSSEIAWPPLALAGAALAAVAALSAARVRSIAVFALLGVVVWFCVLRSGVHATIAGVLLGLLVPTRTQLDPDVFETNVEDFTREFQASRAEERALLAEGDPDDADRDALFEGRERREALLGRLEEQIEMMEAPSERLVHRINPWVSYAVLPVFALANAGVALSAESLARTAQDALAWAVAAALVVGKPVGIFGFAWLAAKTRLAHLPQDVGWHHVVGMGLLAGIGFTVSLFIGQLAFPDDAEALDAAKVAILAASLVAGLAGYGALRWAAARDA
jgi:NhaA family Na+:H+ antiporter